MMRTDTSSPREAALAQVSQASFAMAETNLYLDTHPCDGAAMAYYNQMKTAYENARAAYEAQYGPLSAIDASDTSYWSWVKGPWPWEGGDC